MGHFAQNCTEMINSQPILPVPSVDLVSRPREPEQRRGNCLCCCTPSLQFYSAVLAPPPRRHRWQAVVCDRPSQPAMITFSSLPRRTTSLYPRPTPQRRQLTYLAVSVLIQKTSKQMRSSPLQRCRPAAHASCQETPHTCWLCTFPAKQRQK